MQEELIDTHEVLIGEYEALEREYDQLKLAKMREGARLRNENRELRRQLKVAVEEIDELQSLLARSWVK
jgi:predicted RNase H-like nuclease (RuvC/YqgF family)